VTELILHHYDASPYSEKIRLVFGAKGLTWSSVDIPMMLPRPDVMALTGGYRKVPVLQIGADIYCDTQLIMRELERRFPTPALIARGNRGLATMVGLWTDRGFFQAAAGMMFATLGPHLPDAFIKDRESMTGATFNLAAIQAGAPLLRDQIRAHLAMIADQLEDGRPHLLGEPVSLADISAYMNIWFLRRMPGIEKLFEPFPRVLTWEARVKAIGHGKKTDMTSERALEIAATTEPATAPRLDRDDPRGLKPGDQISVMPDDYGKVPVTGTLVASDAQSIALERVDERAGRLVVHFPRAGFIVSSA
jgi:glutathione S-transferase